LELYSEESVTGPCTEPLKSYPHPYTHVHCIIPVTSIHVLPANNLNIFIMSRLPHGLLNMNAIFSCSILNGSRTNVRTVTGLRAETGVLFSPEATAVHLPTTSRPVSGPPSILSKLVPGSHLSSDKADGP
jgi:hypothetical protein